jgi:predicted nucleotidyltransferase
MAALDDATLSTDERVVLDLFVSTLAERMGDELHATWLFGSRARGETVGELSDIDVLAIVDRAGWDDSARVYRALHDAAREVSLPDVAWSFSVHVHEPAWLDRRRAVASFFVSEVDRDRIDLTAAA